MAKIKKAQLPHGLLDFLSQSIVWWAGALGFMVAAAFFLQTQDSAQIKITLYQVGITGLFALWLSKLFTCRAKILTKHNLRILLPFILYFLYNISTLFLQPYAAARIPFAINFTLSAMLFIIVYFEFNFKALNTIFPLVSAMCWLVYGYGFLQVINNFLLPGVDPLFWTDFFGKRIFSTIANPNFFASFCVFTIMLLTARFLQTRQKGLIVLIAIGFVDLFFTESKGAWLAFSFTALLFGFIYLNSFVGLYKKHRLKFNMVAIILIFITVLITGYFAGKRLQSINFRLYTWQSAVEMVKASPVFGTGAGSFSIIYPKYKKPQIFYIEGIHNAQTQHAENFYLEQLATLGCIGFSFWLFAVFYFLKFVYKKFKNFDYAAAAKEDKGQMLLLLGLFAAVFSIYVHNFVDISIYFVSTSYFLALFLAIIFKLCGPQPDYAPNADAEKDIKPHISLKFIKIICSTVVTYVLAMLLNDFIFITTGVAARSPLFYVIYWFFILIVLGGAGFVFFKIIAKTKIKEPSIILALTAIIIYRLFGFFMADFYLAIAGHLAEQANPKAATYYEHVTTQNPFAAEPYHFKGIFFTNRADLNKAYKPEEGDSDFVPNNDFERALRNLETSSKMAPYGALVDYDIGTLYTAMAKQQLVLGDTSKAVSYFNTAQGYFYTAIKLDPVNENTYYQLANIALAKRDFVAAAAWIKDYLKGPYGVETIYIERHRNNQKALTSLRNIEGNLKAGA